MRVKQRTDEQAKEINKLRSQLRYYQLRDNQEKMQEIGTMIEEFEKAHPIEILGKEKIDENRKAHLRNRYYERKLQKTKESFLPLDK